MTPMHLMTRQTFLGWMLVGLGLLLVALAVAPIVVALRAHVAPPSVTLLFLAFLGVGIAVLVLGAWLLPSSGVGPVVTQFVAVVGPYVPRLPGRSRVGDPPSEPPPSPPTPPSEP